MMDSTASPIWFADATIAQGSWLPQPNPLVSHRNLRWYERNHEQIAAKHEGKWIGIWAEHIIYVGASFEEVHDQQNAAELANILILYVRPFGEIYL